MSMALYNIGDFVEMVPQRATAVPIPKLWYLLRMHPNYDLKAERQLRDAGISAYVPKEKRSVKTVWGRRALRETPIFPGALFVPDYDADLARLKQVASGIGGFVRSANAQALTISLLWMGRIRKFEERLRSDGNHRRFKLGQAIRIVGGQFDMWEGTVERLDSHHRLRILISLLDRQVPVELDEDQIEAV